MSSLKLTVNGEPASFPGPTNVAELIADFDVSGRGVAIAVNGEVVPRSAWSTTSLASGDRVEVLRAAQGG
jgi:sulfur carrier protein